METFFHLTFWLHIYYIMVTQKVNIFSLALSCKICYHHKRMIKKGGYSVKFNADHDYSMDEFIDSQRGNKPKEPTMQEVQRKAALYLHRWQISNRKIVISSYAAACVVGAFISRFPQDASALDYLFVFLQIGAIGLIGCIVSLLITELFCMLLGGDDYSDGSPLLLFLSALLLIPIVAVLICYLRQ